MTPMNLQDWPRDEQIVPEAVLDCLCHRLLTLLSPTQPRPGGYWGNRAPWR